MANLRIEESPLARHVQGEHVMPSIMSCRQAAELDHAFERNGWSSQEVKRLSSGSLLAEVRKVVLGNAEIKITKHIIDCDADPFVLNGWKVEEHHKGGQFKFDASQINLYLSATQKKGSTEGNKLRKELAGKPVLNANVLDFLLAHTELIPEEWKGKYVFFWGTIYRHLGGDLFVRCLCWDVEEWCWSDPELNNALDGNNPAALRIG